MQRASTYAYDPLMRLAVIDSSNPALDARLGYDGREIVFEGLSSNRTRRYVFGPGVDEPLVAYLVTSTGTTRSWFHADERGSILAQSFDGGTLPNIIGRYDEYGAGAGTGRFHYTGQYWLADRDLHYYRARIYDPRLGRFLQTDPIGYGGGMNIYAYVGGDPVNFTDPLGLKKDGEEEETEETVYVNGIPVGGSAGAMLLGGHSGASGSGSGPWSAGYGGPSGPHAAVCANADCSTVIVTAPTTKTPFVFNGRAWVWNPHWVKPWWSKYLDYSAAGLFIGPVIIIAGAEVTLVAGVGFEYTVTNTVLRSIASRPFINSKLLIREIMKTGKGVRDPGGVRGALRYDVPGSFRGSAGTWELVINPRTKMIYHFLFRGS